MVSVQAVSLDGVWDILGRVPDPEIPVVSVVDLGIVRDVSVDGDVVEVSVTPTYSGCPATRVIATEIERALAAEGLAARIKHQLAPPWTTDWITDDAKARLEAYGIAPPRAEGAPQHCPRCKSRAVEKISQFGSTPCKAQWRCTDCLEPFEYFKCL